LQAQNPTVVVVVVVVIAVVVRDSHPFGKTTSFCLFLDQDSSWLWWERNIKCMLFAPKITFYNVPQQLATTTTIELV